ncbi:17647_t:CDS:2 [Cetraspora pellucida]|uniref:17647_t:CDS:1 n=1 Tax=Cetraspora pellucida TaxID=1433469 RepID=A0ACA9LNP2_9GLOM|nr:17647_t:CDS:2 [Cetraspora pellucida]
MNNQYCSAHKTTPYNLVFGQYPHSDTNFVDILENTLNDQQNEELNSLFDDLPETDSEMTFVTANSDIGNDDDDNLNTVQVYSMTPQEIIEINDSDSSLESMNTVESQRYTLQEKQKWRASSNEVLDEITILNIKKHREYIRNKMQKQYKTKRERIFESACQFGILENWYPANELEPLGTPDYPALDVVPLNNTISLRQAIFRQNYL